MLEVQNILKVIRLHYKLSTSVHVVMYLYYFLAAMGPSLQPYLWWKKYITQLQLVQFVIVIIHGSQVIFYKDCDFPATY